MTELTQSHAEFGRKMCFCEYTDIIRQPNIRTSATSTNKISLEQWQLVHTREDYQNSIQLIPTTPTVTCKPGIYGLLMVKVHWLRFTLCYWPPVKRCGTLYNFSACLSVSLSDDTFRKLDIGSSLSHVQYISREYGASSYRQVIGSRSGLQEQKGRKSLSPPSPAFLSAITPVM